MLCSQNSQHPLCLSSKTPQLDFNLSWSNISQEQLSLDKSAAEQILVLQACLLILEDSYCNYVSIAIL